MEVVSGQWSVVSGWCWLYLTLPISLFILRHG